MQLKLIILFLLFGTVGYSQAMYLFDRDTAAFTGPPVDDSLIFHNMAHQLAYVSVGTLASDGDKVYKWTNVGTVANQFYQGTSAARPNYRTNQVNGYPALEFRYAQQMIDTLAGSTADQGMLFFVVKWSQDTTTTRKWVISNAGASRPSINVTSTERESFFSSAATVSGASSINNTWHLLTYTMPTSTTINIRRDGTQTASGSKTAGQKFWGTPIRITLGCEAANFGRFYLAEVIGTASISTTKRAAYEEYLRNKYNLY